MLSNLSARPPTASFCFTPAGEQATIEKSVSLLRVIPLDIEIARAGGLYKRDYGKSHGVGLADAILAAAAELKNEELKTLNIKHYPMVKGLSPDYTKEKAICSTRQEIAHRDAPSLACELHVRTACGGAHARPFIRNVRDVGDSCQQYSFK